MWVNQVEKDPFAENTNGGGALKPGFDPLFSFRDMPQLTGKEG